ncbi:MAG TPA: polysaccharide deacetylase family protein [Solirubrobacteraceae bacterium]|nr:polysaccharide deacetylase family protein [Solirubrobacteraceae bacterium]
MPPASLEAQLRELTARGWRGATLTEAIQRPPYQRTLVVTFDDGFLSVLDNAEPILTKLGIPGTLFVPTAFMDTRQPLLWAGLDQWSDTAFAQELIGLEWADLTGLVARGWEIGSHTCTHPLLTQLEPDAAHRELLDSRLACEQHLGVPCNSVAYPYGHVNQQVADAAQEAGYEVGVSLANDLAPAGPLRSPRIGIYHDDNPWRFMLKTNVAIRRLRATRMWPARASTPHLGQ